MTKDELELIDSRCGPLLNYLESDKSTPCDLTKIPKDLLFDYEFQKKYSPPLVTYFQQGNFTFS